MQSKPDQNSKHLGEPALSSARMQAIREAARRVTLELLQQQQAAQTPISQAQETASNDGQTAEAIPTQGTVEKPKTRLLAAIQPVLEVVADSALRQSDPDSLQRL
jgi:non-ribosomal peptide synthetase component F